MTIPRNRLKALRALGQKKFREAQGLFVVEGVRVVREAATAEVEIVEALCTEEAADDVETASLIAGLEKRCPVWRVNARDLNAVADTRNAQGIVAVLRRKPAVQIDLRTRGESLLVALDAVADPGNAGAIIRTCDWFGADGILLGRNSVELFNPKVVRSTAGSIFHVPIMDAVDLPLFLTSARTAGYSIIVTDLHGSDDPEEIPSDGRAVMVFGNEAWGVSDAVRSLADRRVRIPRFGKAESLNVAVAAGVLLASYRRRGKK